MIWQDRKLLAAALRDQACADLLVARYLLVSAKCIVNGRTTTFGHAVVAKCQQAVEKLTKGLILFHDGTFDPAGSHTPLTDLLSSGRALLGKMQKFVLVLDRNNGLVRNLRWLEAFAPQRPRMVNTEVSVPLASLPSGVAIPGPYADHVWFDGSLGRLWLRGSLSDDELAELNSLSIDAAFRNALAQLRQAYQVRRSEPQPLSVISVNSEYPAWCVSRRQIEAAAEQISLEDSGVQAVRSALALFRTLARSGPWEFTTPLDLFLTDYPMSTRIDEFEFPSRP